MQLLGELVTPALVVDADVLDRSISRMAEAARFRAPYCHLIRAAHGPVGVGCRHR